MFRDCWKSIFTLWHHWGNTFHNLQIIWFNSWDIYLRLINLCFGCCSKCFAPDGVPKKVPTALVHLKYLCIEYVCFLHNASLPSLFLLIRSSPNLEKLRVEVITLHHICVLFLYQTTVRWKFYTEYRLHMLKYVLGDLTGALHPSVHHLKSIQIFGWSIWLN